MLKAVALLLHVVVGPVAAAHALMYKRDARAAFGWVVLCLLFPVLGPIFYYAFGINRVRTKARQLHGQPIHWFRFPHDGAATAAPVTATMPAGETVPDAIARLSQAVSGRPLSEGNRVRPLFNGEEAYPEMLAAIESATRSVYLMTYILENNRTGRRLLDALEAAQRRGTVVRLLLDGFGDWYSLPRSSGRARRRGIHVKRFLPPRLVPPTLRVNLRNHRKVLVVDGELGFTGGMNIGDRHLAAERGCQDVHFAITGPVVRELERLFAADWRFAAGEEIAIRDDERAAHGDARCGVISTGPDDDLDKLVTVLVGAISAARHTIHWVTPYFLPPREVIAALQAAALKGVRVRVVLPARSNLPFVHWATRNMLWELLQRGVEVYYQPPPFAHTKLFMVDGEYLQVGSANVDPRSLRLNFEMALEVFDRPLVASLTRRVERLIEGSRSVLLQEVDSRSVSVRLRDAFFWLFSPFL
ncbi:MAG: cardiolipin synthase [Nitrospirota bacterium]|jgi:cardiolipin synthase